MCVAEQRWSRCPWTFSYRPLCKGSPVSALILCIGVTLDSDFAPLCFLLSTFSPDVFHLCFSCHRDTMQNLNTGLQPLFPLYPDTPHGRLPHQDLHFKHTFFPGNEHVFLPDVTSPPPVDSQTFDSFSSFPVFAAAHPLLFSPVPKSTVPSWRPRPRATCNHTLEVINTAMLRPLLFHLHCPPTFIAWVFPARTKI